MEITVDFARRFVEANDGLRRAIELEDEALYSYYLGASAGLLAAVLPQDEATSLLSVRAPGAASITMEVNPVLSRARELIVEAHGALHPSWAKSNTEEN